LPDPHRIRDLIRRGRISGTGASVTSIFPINLHRSLKLLRPAKPAPRRPETSVATPSERSAAFTNAWIRSSQRRALTGKPERSSPPNINALIAANRKSRGTAFVRIDGNVGQVGCPFRWKDSTFHCEMHLAWAIGI
jgi:hypothetical protein